MTLGIMQPYFMPYIGYYQLIQACDLFMFYDSVQYIKQGWVNRNYYVVNGEKKFFTIPLSGASSNKRIMDVKVDELGFSRWKRKFYKTLANEYRHAPFYNEILGLLDEIFRTDRIGISDLAVRSNEVVVEYIGMKVNFDRSSRLSHSELNSQARVIEICKEVGATRYINPIGGVDLYSSAEFTKEGIELCFISPVIEEYGGRGDLFVPGLSILDVLMYNDPKKALSMMTRNNITRG
jgi:hypothetical protein